MGTGIAQTSAPAAPTVSDNANISIPAIPEFQASSTSIITGTTPRYTTDVFNVVNVSDWTKLDFDRAFVFLGGNNVVATGGIEGGFATNAFGGYLGCFFNGNFFTGDGKDNGADDSSYGERSNRIQWKDALAIMYGREEIGGIRFDLLFTDTAFSGSNEYGESAGSGSEINKYFYQGVTTTLQWGKELESFTPKVMIGVKWPDYTKNESNSNITGDTLAEMWEKSAVAVKLEALGLPYDLRADYQFTLEFPKVIKGSTSLKNYSYTESSYVDNVINVYFAKNIRVADKFQIRVRPQLQFDFYFNDHKVVEDFDNYPAGQETRYHSSAPEFIFQFRPSAQLGARWTPVKRLSLYTGLTARLFTFKVRSLSAYTKQDGTEVKNKPVEWEADGFWWGNSGILNFAGEFEFTDSIAVEFGVISDLFSFKMPGSSNTDVFAFKNPFGSGAVTNLLSGNLMLKFKL